MGAMSPRPVKDRVEVRIKLLEQLIDSRIAETALASRKSLWEERSTPASVVAIRSRLLLATDDHPGQTRIQAVKSSKGAAVQVLLLALFEVQVRKPPRKDNPVTTALPLRYGTESKPSWVDFTAFPTEDSTKRRTHARTPTDNLERQIKRALDRLADCGRVELKPRRTHGRYKHFVLLNEGTNNGPGGRPAYYSVPVIGAGRARRKVVTIPVSFFLNGWVDALTDNEIITYLALRLMAQAFPEEHKENGVYLAQADRQEQFNLDRAFEAHRMLARYGLIETIRDPQRNADGTMMNFHEVGTGGLHHFKLNDGQLDEPGIPTAVRALGHFAAGHDSDLAAIMGAIDP